MAQQASHGVATHCYWVIDDSGSMSGWETPIRAAVQAIVDKDMSAQRNVQHFFVCFSNSAIYYTAKDIPVTNIPFVGMGTNIASGFSLLNEKVLTNLPLPSKIIINFISDGEDNNAGDIVARLRQMGGLAALRAATCVLFTVAVGWGFPTNMVVDALRPNYHNASDYLPLVLPLEDRAECKEVFQQLRRYMWEQDHLAAGPPKVGLESSEQQITDAASAIYNHAVLAARTAADKSMVVAGLTSAKAELEDIAAVVRKRDAKRTALLQPAHQVATLKPLVSRLLTKYRQERSDALGLVLDLTTQLNKLINEAVNGQLLSRLPDWELAQALGYGNRAGRHLQKAAKYHSAEFSQTKESLLAYLGRYGPAQAAADAEVQDYIMTQEEALSDAKACAASIDTCSMNSVVGLVDTLAILGRTLQVKTSDGTQINPWLVSVVGMPTIMKVMNSVDFFEQHKGQYQDDAHNEAANCLLPITTHPESILREYVGQHLTTFFLVRNEALNFPQSLACLVAATVTYCLSQPHPMPTWMAAEVDQALTTYLNVYERKGTTPPPHAIGSKYMRRLMGPGAATALITQSDDDPQGLRCEHLTKPVLALAMLLRFHKRNAAEEPAWSSSEQLRRFMVAFLVEMVGRGVDRSQPLHSFLPTPRMHHSMTQLLELVPQEEALQAFTLAEATKVFEAAVRPVLLGNPAAGLAESVEELLGRFATLPVTCYQFSEASVVNTFTALDAMAGNHAPPGFFELMPLERLAIFMHGYKQANSAERCKSPVAEVTPQQVEQLFVNAHLAATVEAAPEYIKQAYVKHLSRMHLGPMRHFPQTFTHRYLHETGVDVETLLAINPETRLPRNCCAHPECDGFLRLCKPAFVSKSEPRISDLLLNHLQPLGFAPAYTRCLVNHRKEAPERIARKVLSCSELLPSKDAGAQGRAQERVSQWWTRFQATLAEQGITRTLAEEVAEDVAAFKGAEALWSGYDGFKAVVTERLVPQLLQQAEHQQ